jgi:hypothetical protein
MATRKQVPPPVIDRRMLVAAGLLLAFSLGLATEVALSGLATVILLVVLWIVAGALVFIAWDNWRKQYRAWASRPIKAKQVKREVQG